jgi:hypothetical protein
MKKLLFIFLSTFFGVNAIAQCPYSLVAHWTFNGPTPVIATKEAMNGWTPLTIAGTATVGQSGLPNTAWQFNGISDFLQYPSSPLMDLTSWTIVALVQPNGFWNGLCQGNSILWRGNQSSHDFYGLLYTDNPYDMCVGNTPECNFYTPSNQVFECGAAGYPAYPESDYACGVFSPPLPPNPFIIPGKWYCVTAVYDGVTGSMALYVDANLVLSEVGTWPNQYLYPAVNDLFIGSSNSLGIFPYFFNGAIDDIKLFNGAMHCPPFPVHSSPSDQYCYDAANGWKTANPEAVVQTTKAKAVEISPNPTTGVVNITSSIPVDQKGSSITVTNSLGQLMFSKTVDNSGKTILNIQNLPAGVYVIKVNIDGQITSKKVVKE